MCYDVKAKLKSQLKRAKQKNDFDWIKELEEKLKPFGDNPIFHASGFEHPELLIYEQDAPNSPEIAKWGLIPDWVKDQQEKENIWNKTLNARIETIFEKKSFQKSAHHQRCILQIDGFFEHHYRSNQPYPYYIYRKDKEPMSIAGLSTDWTDLKSGKKIKSFAIVTTKAQGLLAEIHNNPNLKEPRIPLLLDESQEDFWLNQITESNLKEMAEITHENMLQGHLVAPLRGKKALGNVEEATEAYYYDAFNTLF